MNLVCDYIKFLFPVNNCMNRDVSILRKSIKFCFCRFFAKRCYFDILLDGKIGAFVKICQYFRTYIHNFIYFGVLYI